MLVEGTNVGHIYCSASTTNPKQNTTMFGHLKNPGASDSVVSTMYLAYYIHSTVKETKQQSIHTSTWRNLQSRWKWDIPTRWESSIHMNTCLFTMLGVFNLKNVFFVHSACEETVVSYPDGLICGWSTKIRFQISLEANPFSPCHIILALMGKTRDYHYVTRQDTIKSQREKKS